MEMGRMSLGSRPAGLSSSLLSVNVGSFLEANRDHGAGSWLGREGGSKHSRCGGKMLSARRHDAKSRGKIYLFISMRYNAA
jgi:hypothetical protein